tara:strand:- start:219 stop:494 length:276 start_codon:yes stop_codon:yes gene_type:complete
MQFMIPDSNTSEEVKRKRGRPASGLTKNELAIRSKANLDVKNLAINGELLQTFNVAKEEHSKLLGFKLTNKQFFAVLIGHWNWTKEQKNEC